MDNLISRAAAIEAALDGADEWDGGCNPTREEYIRRYMAKVPAMDAAPVVHAKWLHTITYWYYCSNCGNEPPNESNYTTPYCSHCGAKMDYDEDEDDAE